MGRNVEEGTNAENEHFYQTALEISGPKIPSPGPIGNLLLLQKENHVHLLYYYDLFPLQPLYYTGLLLKRSITKTTL